MLIIQFFSSMDELKATSKSINKQKYCLYMKLIANLNN